MIESRDVLCALCEFCSITLFSLSSINIMMMNDRRQHHWHFSRNKRAQNISYSTVGVEVARRDLDESCPATAGLLTFSTYYTVLVYCTYLDCTHSVYKCYAPWQATVA
jgi:hypothetical protein